MFSVTKYSCHYSNILACPSFLLTESAVSSGCFSGASNCVVWVFFRGLLLCRLGVFQGSTIVSFGCYSGVNKCVFRVFLRGQHFFKIWMQSSIVVFFNIYTCLTRNSYNHFFPKSLFLLNLTIVGHKMNITFLEIEQLPC